MVKNRSAIRFLPSLTLAAVGWMGVATVLGVPPSLPAAVPEDVVAAWFVDTRGDAAGAATLGSLNVARFMIDQAGELGLLSKVDPVSRGWIDTLAALSVVLDYPHAVALFNAEARRLEDGGHRLAALYGALILETNGENTAVEQRIQRLLNTYTNSDESELSSTDYQGRPVFTLRDRRLPEWVVITWGRTERHYIVAIGEGSYERVVKTIEGRTPALPHDGWFQTAFQRLDGKAAWLALWADFQRLRTTADVGLADKVSRVRDVLGLHNVQRGLWTVRFDDRAMNAVGYVSQDGRDLLRPLTAGHVAGVRADRLVPAQATGYAIFDAAPRQVLGLIAEAFLAARSDGSRRRITQYWRALEAKSGVSIDNDILAHLGRGVVIHNHPRHALRLPLMWTIVVPVSGDHGRLREAIDGLIGAWKEELRDVGSTAGLRRRPDGIWHLFVGIAGPAVGMSDDWLVISFSPEAVRQNLDLLKTQPADSLAGPTDGSRSPQ